MNASRQGKILRKCAPVTLFFITSSCTPTHHHQAGTSSSLQRLTREGGNDLAAKHVGKANRHKKQRRLTTDLKKQMPLGNEHY